VVDLIIYNIIKIVKILGMEKISLIDKIKSNIKKNKDDYKGFLISMLIFNFIIIGIAELTIIHPPEIFKKHKYENRKKEKKIEKNDAYLYNNYREKHDNKI
jgi:hypothetical protein